MFANQPLLAAGRKAETSECTEQQLRCAVRLRQTKSAVASTKLVVVEQLDSSELVVIRGN
jgi:hypothetical protein